MQKEMDYINSWNELILEDYWLDYYDRVSSKDMDHKFFQDIRVLSKIIKNLPESEKKFFANILSDIIEIYIENKVEKEIENSFYKILNV